MLAQTDVEVGIQQSEVLQSFNFQGAGLVILIFNLLLFSACWSASIAEDRVRSAKISFILGFVLPVVYPIYILFTMGLKAKVESESLVDDSASEDSEIYVEDATTIFDESALDYNEHFFRKYYLAHTEGKKYVFEVEGLPVTVDRIVEVRIDLLVVQADGGNGEAQTIRIPYNTIENFSEI